MARRLVLSGVILAVLVAGLAGIFLMSKSRNFQLFGELVARVETDRPLIALTLDDGPSARFTGEVLAILREKNIPATFFVTGKETEENREQAQAIIAAGHELGNHSWSHRNFTLAGMQTVRDEIERTDAAIRAAGYEREIYFRPPFGKKLVTLPWYLAQNDRKTIMWDIEPESFPDVADDADALTRHVVERARNGSIILMHVMYRSREASRQALPKIIDELQSRGFSFVTVSRLLENQDAR